MTNPHFGIDFHEVIAQLVPPTLVYMTARDESCGHRAHWTDDLIDGHMPYWGFLPEVCASCADACMFDPDICSVLVPEPYAIVGIQELAKIGTLHLVSDCGDAVAPAVENWLVEHEIRSFFATVSAGKVNKVAVCQLLNLDCLVDDKPDTLLKVSQRTSTTPVIFDKAWNRHIDVGFRVANWPSLVTLFKQIQQHHQTEMLHG